MPYSSWTDLRKSVYWVMLFGFSWLVGTSIGWGFINKEAATVFFAIGFAAVISSGFVAIVIVTDSTL